MKEGRRFFPVLGKFSCSKFYKSTGHELCLLTNSSFSVWDPPQKKNHAEIRFINKIRSLDLDKTQSYKITCYISWSPCSFCAGKLVALVKGCPHLSLRIFTSRLYYHWAWKYQEGLRCLWKIGIPLLVMKESGREADRCPQKGGFAILGGQDLRGKGDSWTGRMVAQLTPGMWHHLKGTFPGRRREGRGKKKEALALQGRLDRA